MPTERILPGNNPQAGTYLERLEKQQELFDSFLLLYQKPEAAKEQIAALVSQASPYLLNKYSRCQDPLFFTVRSLVRDLLYVGGRDMPKVVKVLTSKDVHVETEVRVSIRQIHRYHYVFAGQKEQARTVIKTDPRLDPFRTNPVILISGITNSSPSTSQLRKHAGVSSLFKEFDKVGIHPRKWHQVEGLFFSRNTTITVWRYGHGLYYPTPQQEELREIIEEIKQQLKQ